MPLAGSQCGAAQFRHLAEGIMVDGPCECVVGVLCSLTVLSENETYWDTLNKEAQEIVLYFLGPSRAVAELQANHFSPARASWTASFRLWDAGDYQAIILGGCNAASGLEKLADFSVTIVPRQGGGQLTPCSYGQGFQWVKQGEDKWEWTNHPCAPPVVPAADYAYLMRRKGFRRVLFVGDCHQRVLYQHLKNLLGAPIGDDDLNKPKHDMKEVINAGDPERELHLHFYWVDGIYANGEFGCTDRGMYSGRNETNSYPQIQPGADVISLDAGHWTAYWCTDAWQAFNKHLPAYLDWGESLLSPQSRLVWRTAPSWMPECRRKYVTLASLNRLALEAISSRPYAPFSSWDVEAPRFSELREGHYSWTTVDDTGSEVVRGVRLGRLSRRRL
ncbi:hypothetical protein KFL_004870030 [Klebsormidium nitens]|uniref:Uncharacterized protein n=1 Tax=Klebsormidium nitens TaxID=105231 RepID=A0A1Y1ILW2_KLENI|nr:hypothetical protein KFL_004870030 [Klebsormidium nitens]|eukprot:GAQ89098.1 hypothetical protein KFL_004870030 [Klebsormidium nitens]